MTVGAKGIADPVHGTISLSSVEARVISTRAFQRLRSVKQLGLASMVFPGADYSRFSHCLGVCHITGRIITALKATGVDFSEAEEQQYRLAALLHDVGHYPFSHSMEVAVQDHYSELLTQDEGAKPGTSSVDDEATRWLNHEAVGKEVLNNNAELRDVLKEFGFAPEAIYQIFARETPPKFSNLVSSDLDADRIDYLLRTAHHTGLTYGAVDLDYLLSQMRVDGSSHICLHPKALRTADHFLLGRYFDYQQVAFHKTVAGLEWILIEVIRALLKFGHLDCSAKAIRERIASGDWESFQDSYIVAQVRELREAAESESLRLKADALLFRRPPKMVAQVEYLGKGDSESAKVIRGQKRLLRESVPKWSKEFGVSEDLWHVWDNGLTFTKVGSTVPISALAADTAYAAIDPDKTEQAVRILNPRTKQSEPIMADRRSLMSVLADQRLYSLRLYVLLPEGRESERQAISDAIRGDLKDEINFI